MAFILENPLPSDLPPIFPSYETTANICIKIKVLFENATKIIDSIDQLSDADKEPFYKDAEVLLVLIEACQHEAQIVGNNFIVMCCVNSAKLIRCAVADVDIWIARLSYGPIPTVVSHAHKSIAYSPIYQGTDELQTFDSLNDDLKLEYAMRVLIVKVQAGLAPLTCHAGWVGPWDAPLETAPMVQKEIYQKLLDLSEELVGITRLRVERLYDSVCALPGYDRYWPRQFNAIREQGKGVGEGVEEEKEETTAEDMGSADRVLGGETSIEEVQD